MDFRYASTIKTFRTIRDFKPDNDPSLSVDSLLDSPAALIHDYSLNLFDDEIAAAVVHTDIRKDKVSDYYDDYSEADFIDPNAKKEAELSEDVLSEIELKFDDINKKLKIILSSLNLRLYADNRPALKKSLYADLFKNYFAEYEYITQDIRIRLSSIISVAVDKSFRELTESPKHRASSLFTALIQKAEPYIESRIAETQNKSAKFTAALYKTVVKQYIIPESQSSHYSQTEYDMICKMMKKYIEKKCVVR